MLLFLAAVFDDYKLKDNVISFGSTANIKKYDALVKNIEDIEREVEAFNKRQLDAIEAGKRKVVQGLAE